jgi:hypothetical protein
MSDPNSTKLKAEKVTILEFKTEPMGPFNGYKIIVHGNDGSLYEGWISNESFLNPDKKNPTKLVKFFPPKDEPTTPPSEVS